MSSSSTILSYWALIFPMISLSMVMTPLSRLRQNCKSGFPLRRSSTSVVKPPMSTMNTRGVFKKLPALGDHRGVGLGVDQHPPDVQVDGLLLVGEFHHAPAGSTGQTLSRSMP